MRDTAQIRIELEGPLFHLVENWRRAQRKIPPRSEAVRTLLEQALAASDRETRATTS
jgi:hypothetical protein